MALPSEDSYEDKVRRVIRKDYEQLAENLKLSKILEKLFETRVITLEQKQNLEASKNTKGEISATKILFDMIMKKEVPVSGFMVVLNQLQSLIYQVIQNGIKKIDSGEWTLEDIDGKYSIKLNIYAI